ncbi:hypothetical protein [Kitasatospora sp. NPDC093558]|uniref:hypothetical protein n=1 Tax=Kitasatospora sp. NPDC093558 TaxID=3155201 RepID=UPI00341AE173
MTTVTTAGNNGAPEGPEGGAPQEDDPFGYLYRPAEGASGQPAEPQQGVPRTPYSRPMEVGRAQYGQQQPYPPRAQQQQPQYFQQGGAPQQGPGQQYPQQYGHQQPDYGNVPTQQTRYAEHSRPQPGDDRQGSSGRSKGAVIGAVAVVAAIAIGAGIALSTGDPGDDKKAVKTGQQTATSAAPGTSGPGTPSGTSSASASPSASASGGPVTVDAGQLQGQNAPSGNTVKGAKSADGGYLTLQPGGSVSWTGEVPAAGTYKLTVHFNNAAGDVRGAASVNGKDWPSGLAFKNYSPGKDPASSWYSTWILPQLQAGSNTITMTVPSGGPILVDQITVEPSS